MSWTTETTAPRVLAIIKKQGISQEAFARKLGLSQATVNRWCKGHHVPQPYIQSVLESYESE